MGECAGHVSIIDRVAMQAAVARTVANPLTRSLYTSLHKQVVEPGFEWQDAERWLVKLDALTLPGEPTAIVSLKASLRAWATMGRSREAR